MNYLTDSFYWISTGLLVPVMLFLLAGFVYSLAMIGSVYAQYRDRRQYRRHFRELLGKIDTEGISTLNFSTRLTAYPGLLKALGDVQGKQWREPYTSKAVADFELAGEKLLNAPRTLMRMGPMLGLMGTLIPMGPALVGLASGDIVSMAMNMQVAFSTTVLGIFMSGVGFIIHSLRKRWFSEDFHNLQFLIRLAENENGEA